MGTPPALSRAFQEVEDRITAVDRKWTPAIARVSVLRPPLPLSKSHIRAMHTVKTDKAFLPSG